MCELEQLILMLRKERRDEGGRDEAAVLSPAYHMDMTQVDVY